MFRTAFTAAHKSVSSNKYFFKRKLTCFTYNAYMCTAPENYDVKNMCIFFSTFYLFTHLMVLAHFTKNDTIELKQCGL